MSFDLPENDDFSARHKNIERAIQETGGQRVYDGLDMHLGYEDVRRDFTSAGFKTEIPPAGYVYKLHRGEQEWIAYTPEERMSLHEQAVRENDQREANALARIDQIATQHLTAQAIYMREQGMGNCGDWLHNEPDNPRLQTARSKKSGTNISFLELLIAWVFVGTVFSNIVLWNQTIDEFGTGALAGLIALIGIIGTYLSGAMARKQ
jgi:hypothetical protein